MKGVISNSRAVDDMGVHSIEATNTTGMSFLTSAPCGDLVLPPVNPYALLSILAAESEYYRSGVYDRSAGHELLASAVFRE
jgi:hypothetical protein